MYKSTPRRRSAAPTQYKFKLDNFYGCDMTNDDSNVHPNYSPNCVNMIRDTLGKPRKRMGYHLLDTKTGNVNGFHTLVTATENKYIIHIGTSIYSWNNATKKVGTSLYAAANDKLSKSIQISGKLYIFDGLKLLQYDGTNIVTVESVAYIPTVLIAKTPTGGGAAYEPINLLQPKRWETFSGTTTATVYQLASASLDSVDEVWKMNSSGVFEKLTVGTHYSVNLVLGQVTFVTAPGESPAKPEPNIKILSSKTNQVYKDRINKCDICTLYGVNGAYDRIFASGNPTLPHYDFYCELNNPTYWGDIWYSVLGQDSAKIVGYSIVDNYLATHKNNEENNANIFLRSGELNSKGEPTFPVKMNYQGLGSISKHAHSYIGNEPVFLTKEGIYAVSSNDTVGNKITALRSKNLNGGLLEELNLENAIALTFRDYYMLAINGEMYILDSQHFMSESSYTHRQYDGYYWTNVPVRCMWLLDDTLCFGTTDGKIFSFYTDIGSLASYNDNGVAISAIWSTPTFYGNEFSYNKNFSYFSILLGPSVKSSCKIWAIYDNQRELILDYADILKYFDFSNIDFGAFTFNVDKTPQVAEDKIKINKVDKVQFILENSNLNEPFRPYEVMAIYTESR